MEYPNSHLATFIERPNRFIAICELDSELVKVHVKNTGRNKEILQAGTCVSLVESNQPTRKTKYDLVAAKVDGRWINIDSQAPNVVTGEGVNSSRIILPELNGQVAGLTPEVKFEDARLDFAGQTTRQTPFFIEVKGVTLVNGNIAAFPDAPTTRGLKHVHTLMRAVKEGYQSYLCFIVQLNQVTTMTIYQERFAELQTAIGQAQAAGVHVVAYNCLAGPQSLIVNQPVNFDLNLTFSEK